MNSITPDQYQLTLMLTVTSATVLWEAAARRCTAIPGLSPDDIEEMIGPRCDPSIEDCLLTLALPANIAGCDLDDGRVTKMEGAPPYSKSSRTGS